MSDKNEIFNELKVAPNFVREKIFARHFPDVYREIMSIAFPDGFTFTQKLYHYLHDDMSLKLGVCSVCGNRCKFIRLSKGYSPHCSVSCSQKSSETIRKRKDTLVKRYGVDCPLQTEIAMERRKKSLAENIGGIQEKRKRTFRKRYGCDNPFQNDEIKAKAKRTNLERYNVEYISQNDEIKAKAKHTNRERYGCDNPAQSEAVKEKTRQTNKMVYGCDNPAQSEAVKEKIKRTCLEHYGVEHSMQSDEVKRKSRRTCVKRYGVEHPLQSAEIQEKIKRTCLKKYGVEQFLQSEEARIKSEKTCMKKYGAGNVMQSDEVKGRLRASNVKKYGVGSTLELDSVKEAIKRTCLERYGVEYACMRPEARAHHTISKINLAFAKLLDENSIAYETEFPLGSYSYDFKVGGMLIEINPTITHNSHLNIFGGEATTSDYHSNKSKCAFDGNFNCIHIWDWDDWNKIISMLKPKETLYARKLELREVSETECNEFLNKYHLQGSCKGQAVRLGLYMNDMLVEAMTFGKPRYNKNYEHELLRLCSHSDYVVVGGAERLFKHFVEQYKPASVISYCDASKFDGKVYTRLGFTLKSVSNPSKHWWDGKRHITDNLLRQRGFDQLFNASYGKGTSNEELMLEHKFLPVYDCGQYTFEWKWKDDKQE